MEEQKEYMQYAVTLIFTVLGVSSSYIINISSPISLLVLTFLPVLYGYTASISTNKFNKASLTSLIALIFSVLGGLTALISILYGVGNILVSLFAGGSSFKDFYGSTSLPLIVIGILIGSSVYGYAAVDEEFKQNQIHYSSEKIGQLSQEITKDSNLVKNQKTNQLKVINQTAKSAVLLTQQKIYNETQPPKEVLKSLKHAEKEVPQIILEKTRNNIGNQSSQISEKVAATFENFINQRFFIVIPLSLMLLLSLQPIIGMATAISAKIFTQISKQ